LNGSKIVSKDQERLRRQALDWLLADLTAWGERLKAGEGERAAGALGQWKEDSDLAGVRDADGLNKLPEAERAEWRKLWMDVDGLLKKAGEK
jgi:hypothetical protein